MSTTRLDGPAAEKDFTDLHAWAEVYLPGAGSIGLDPTSGLLAGEGHIPLACTPDPEGAASVTGAVDACEVLFDYRVSLAEQIFPGSELSEQISMAGTEASGTGNMKFALNGALTIGTMDGANVEIREEVGDANIFVFGLTAAEVAALRPSYDPRDRYRANPELARVLDMIRDNVFSPGEPGLFQPIVDSLLQWGDHFLLLADYDAYVACQERVAKSYRNQAAWTRMSILNVVKMGKFSIDRTIQEYAEEIWRVTRVHMACAA